MRIAKGMLVLSLAVSLLLSGCEPKAANRVSEKTAIIVYDTYHPTSIFAAEELQRFLGKSAGLQFLEEPVRQGDWQFELVADAAMEEYSFGYSCTPTANDSVHVRFSGHDPACVLHAVYTFLEDAGFRFEPTGPIVPHTVDLEMMVGKSGIIRPSVAKRGIRFHMNFPQDLSSFTLAEAQEYIRNCARMRMNYAVFHSYPGKLHTGIYDNTKRWAGQPYDEHMEIPDDPLFQNVIHNKQFFRVPELEAYDDLPQQRARLTKEWAGGIFEEVKRMGMTLQFSFEPRLESPENTAAMFMDIVQSYPMIDVIELTTNENGGGGEVDEEGMRKVLEEYFDLKAYDDPILGPLLQQPRKSLVEMVHEIGHNLKVIRKLRKDYAQVTGRDFAIGVYCIPLEYSQLAARLMHLYVPKDIYTAQMPQYGSRWVAKRFAKLPLTPEDWERTICYSWYEFDGMFFFQQMDVNGVHDMIRVALEQSESDQVHAILFNVWTTARNRTTIRYGSLACVNGDLKPHEFLSEYAEKMDITPVEHYVETMDKIDMAIERARDTWNIGFGWGWMWIGWWSTTLTGWNYDVHVDVQNRFEEVLSDLQKLSADTEDGQWYLGFLRNRVQCSIYHYEAVRRLYEILPIVTRPDREPADPSTLTPDQQKKVLQACKDATYWTNKYMSTFVEYMPERGSEGALLNYYYCLPQTVLKLRRMYGGDTEAKTVIINETDSWPAPARWD